MLPNVEPASSHWEEGTLLWDSLKVLVVLMETVEVVRVPERSREMNKIKNLHQAFANMIKTADSVHSAEGRTNSLFSAESGAVSADTLAPSGLVQHLK